MNPCCATPRFGSKWQRRRCPVRDNAQAQSIQPQGTYRRFIHHRGVLTDAYCSLHVILAVLPHFKQPIAQTALAKPRLVQFSGRARSTPAPLPWQPALLARLPDHVFDLSFKEAQAQGLKDGMLATAALRLLATHYLEVQHGHVHVRLDLFGEWQQSVLSRVSGLPIIAAMRAMHVGRGGHLAADLLTERLPGRAQQLPLPCITPRDSAVEDYISREAYMKAIYT